MRQASPPSFGSVGFLLSAATDEAGMTKTEQCIEEMARAFSMSACPESLGVSALEQLVRLAISENKATQDLCIQEDMQRIEEIRQNALSLR